jgi:two-component system chemotaxis response regulator CheB
MRAGAVEFVLKPTHLADQRLAQIEDELLQKVRAVAEIPPERLLEAETAAASRLRAMPSGPPGAVVIGLSTGGPQVLHALLRKMPGDFPSPLAVVIHMPVGFTGPLAERLDQNSALEVLEASSGLAMRPGRCILGRAGQHMLLEPEEGEVVTRLSLSPTSTPYRPSVNQLFQSATRCYREKLLALVLTGMGSDGQEGAAWVKSSGGRVYTQTQESCVVWGMPRAVLESGLSDGELSPSEIVPFLVRLAQP